jgi:hypothetical protein
MYNLSNKEMYLLRPSSRDRAGLPPFGYTPYNSVSPQSLVGTLEVLYEADREAAGATHRRTVDQQQQQVSSRQSFKDHFTQASELTLFYNVRYICNLTCDTFMQIGLYLTRTLGTGLK